MDASGLNGRPRVIVCGGRDYSDRDRVFRELDRLLQHLKKPIIVTGAARGADNLAEEWAFARVHTNVRFHADWHNHGKKAGPIRNAEMVAWAVGCGGKNVFAVAFPGGDGTANCVRRCREAKIKVVIIKE